MIAISVKNLCFGYDKGNALLKNISFDLPQGAFGFILGKNGSGKSTLIKILARILPYSEGNILLYGMELKKLSRRKKAKLMGYLPQFHAPAFPFTVEEVILTGRTPFVWTVPKKDDVLKVRILIEELGIDKFKEKPYSNLSGGERQLVMIARVLAQEPKILLLDEPLSHLDFPNQIKIMELLKNLNRNKGLTILSVIHDPFLAFHWGDFFIFMKDGAILEKSAHIPMDVFLKDLYDISFNLKESAAYAWR
ncbi:MAG: ABC transporter ATP-binding protein [Thermodesulforhabdaceae bacterium]